MKNTALAAGATVAAILMLAACTPTPSTTASGSATPAPAVTVRTTVTATATPAPAPAPPDFDFTSYEGAQIGSNWSQMSAQIGLAVTGNYQCPHFGMLRGTEVVQTYAFTDAMHPNSGSTFFFTQVLDPSSAGPFPRNAEGVGVGSTKAEILAAYPDAVVGSVDDLGAGHITTITVAAPSGGSKYVFGIDGEGATPTTVDLLEWGSDAAGNQWSHLCLGF